MSMENGNETVPRKCKKPYFWNPDVGTDRVSELREIE